MVRRVGAAALGLAALCAAGCDPGPTTDQSTGQGPPVRLLSANIGSAQPLASNDVIQLAFDRLLLPASITRQTFILDVSPPAIPSYDPVTRVVTIAPAMSLVPGQTHHLQIAAPQSSTDPNGLRAIDGALLDPLQGVIVFQIGPVSSTSSPPTIDFCASVYPLFVKSCGSSVCHSGSLPAAGLGLTSATMISATAIGRVAQGANTGPRAAPMSPGRLFGEDMPIVDQGTGGSGNPSNSWLIYKLLLAELPDGGAALGRPLPVQWQPLSDHERSILANRVPGREMPYPSDPAKPWTGLSTTDIETISLWIAQGAAVPAACP